MYYLFNKKTRKLYTETCPWDGKPKVVRFDSMKRANSYKPSKKWSLVNEKTCGYNPLFSRYVGLHSVFNMRSSFIPYRCGFGSGGAHSHAY